MINNIQEKIFSCFKREDVLLVIWYGNRKGKDIDLLVLLQGDFDYSNFQSGYFDVSCVGWPLAWKMILKLDPLITDPILEGEEVVGDSRDLVYAIENIRPGFETCEYLNDKSLIFLNWSEVYFGLGNFKESLNCLRFSLGFSYFSNFYQKNSRVTTLKELKCELDCSFMEEVETCMKEKLMINFVDILNFNKKARRLLTDKP